MATPITTPKEVNGYTHFHTELGIHSYMKSEGGKFMVIECTDEQLHNGDLEFMTEHGMTISKERKKAYQKAWKQKEKKKKRDKDLLNQYFSILNLRSY